MAKHESGYLRVERDFYPTPPWVVGVLAEHIDLAGRRVWECACGDGRMAQALKAAGASVYSSDVVDRGYCDELLDFAAEQQPKTNFDDIITNPPFGSRGKLAESFIASGLRRIPNHGLLALLLPTDFDSAKTRQRFFGDCARFAGKLVLTERVVWFERSDGKKEAPKENTAWFLWRSRTGQRPTLAYQEAAA
jgi:hypothetical protein